MRAIRLSALTAVIIFVVSCGEDQELTSDQTREITTLDERVVALSPTSVDRFQSPQQEAPKSLGGAHGEQEDAGGFTYTAGEGWVAKPKTQFRLVNYALPAGGEIYVSVTGGGILPNLNRWLGQFGQEEITGEQLGKQPRVMIMGLDGYVVEATGSYAGMGRAKQDDMSLLGALAEIDGQLISVKMISTTEEVAQQKAAFMAFCESLTKE